MNNMLLGRTFDYSKSEVGNDIISEEERQKAQTIPNDRSDIKYKMIKSSEDVRDVLDVSGQLSVKVMAGTVDIEGKGSYLKSSVDSENSVEVMVQVYYKTVRFSVELWYTFFIKRFTYLRVELIIMIQAYFKTVCSFLRGI
jgi:hypothetical protein